MTKHDYIDVELSDDREVRAWFRMAPAEPDVGLPEPYIDELFFTEPTVREPTKKDILDLQLNREEDDRIVDEIYDWCNTPPEPQYDTLEEEQEDK